MPPVVAAAAITGLATGVTGIVGATKSSNAAKNANRLQAESTAKAMAIEQENEREARAERARQDAEERRQWEATQRQAEEDRQYARMKDALELEAITAQEARRAPKRAASDLALRTMAQSIGINLPATPVTAWDPAARARAILAANGQTGTGYAQTASRPSTTSMADAVKGATTPGLTETDPRLLVRDGAQPMADVIDYRRKPRYVR